MITQICFYVFSGFALLSAFFVITASKPTRALLSLIFTMFCLSVLYVLLGAPFVAMAHLIVYAGAVLVLFLFVIMLQGIGARDVPLRQRFRQRYLFLATFVSIVFTALLMGIVLAQKLPLPKGIQGTVEAVAHPLFSKYLLPFELISILLLVGVFAAVALAKKEEA